MPSDRIASGGFGGSVQRGYDDGGIGIEMVVAVHLVHHAICVLRGRDASVVACPLD